MTLSTKNKDAFLTPDEKRERIIELKKHHSKAFESLVNENYQFIPKMFYYAHGNEKGLYVSFFPSELSKGTDIYTEKVSKDYVSEDSDRVLYHWPFNPHFDEEYEKTGDPNNFRYLIPVDELFTVNVISTTPAKPSGGIKTKTVLPPNTPFISPKHLNGVDLPLSDMTIRDIAAIMLNKPCSNKQWLNEIITSK